VRSPLARHPPLEEAGWPVRGVPKKPQSGRLAGTRAGPCPGRSEGLSIAIGPERFDTATAERTSVHPDAIWGLFLDSTEGLLMECVQNKVARFRSIQSTGVSLAIDDFGSGLSSLKRAVETAFRYP
jgi:hypothetical protein